MEQTELLPLNVYNKLEATFAAIVAKVQKYIIDEADLIDISDDIDWISMKRSLLQGKLLPAVLGLIKNNFLTTLGIIKDDVLHLPAVQQLLIRSLSNILLDHLHLKWLTRYMQPAAIVQQVVNTAVNDYKEEWKKGTAAARTIKITGAEIIMDADKLKELPVETIQHARVVLDVRSILKQNEWTP